MTDAFFTPSCLTAYADAAALSPTEIEMNSAAFGALLSTGVNGMPPITARFERFQTGNAPGAPVSAPPRIAVGFLSAISPAQRPDVDGGPSVAHDAGLTGRPPLRPV